MSSANANEDEDIERVAASRRRARGLRVAARRALGLARRYRSEEGPRGAREMACVRQALVWRASARSLGSRTSQVAPDSNKPGVARASVPPSSSSQNRQSG